MSLALAENLSAEPIALFKDMRRSPDGRIIYRAYNRFPIGGMLLIKLAIAPFEGDLSAQILAARVLMLTFFCAAALAAYLALCRLLDTRAVPFAATLLAFSSYHMLDMSDVVATEGAADLFGVLLVFHGLVVFTQEGRFGQLVAKTCVALFLGWHVYALLAPFLALGLAGELVEAGRRQARARQNSDRAETKRHGLRLLRALAAQTARSRHTRLGLVAVLVGATLLGYNFGAEYVLFGGERPFAELPSVRSALRRTSVGGDWTGNHPQMGSFPWQFHRVGLMLLPYGLSSPGEHSWHEVAWRASGAPPLAGVGVLATAACFGALLFAPAFRGRRTLWGALALSGFCWAFAMRQNTAWYAHDHETIYFVGNSLVLFTALLLGGRELAASALARWLDAGRGRQGDRTRWRGRVGAGCAIFAAAVFVASSVRMGALGRDADEAARRRAVLGEFERIRAVTRGKDVLVMRHHVKDTAVTRLSGGAAFGYYMAGSVMHYPRTAAEALRLEADGEVDYVLGLRHGCSAPTAETCEPSGNAAHARPLTPTHWFVFLYAPGGVVQAITDAWRRDYQAAVAAGDPLARGASWGFRVDIDVLRRAYARTRTSSPPPPPPSAHDTFDVHLHGGALIYAREPCSEADVAARFFLHVAAPAEALPEYWRASGFHNLDFDFHDQGAIFDGKCVAKVALPDYPIRNVTTGQFAPHGELWSARIDMAEPVP